MLEANSLKHIFLFVSTLRENEHKNVISLCYGNPAWFSLSRFTYRWHCWNPLSWWRRWRWRCPFLCRRRFTFAFRWHCWCVWWCKRVHETRTFVNIHCKIQRDKKSSVITMDNIVGRPMTHKKSDFIKIVPWAYKYDYYFGYLRLLAGMSLIFPWVSVGDVFDVAPVVGRGDGRVGRGFFSAGAWLLRGTGLQVYKLNMHVQLQPDSTWIVVLLNVLHWNILHFTTYFIHKYFSMTLTSFHYVHCARAVYLDRLLSVPWFTKCLWKGTSQLILPTHRRTVSELVKRISIGISMPSQFNRLNAHKRFFLCHGLSSSLVHRTSNRSPHTGLQYTAKTVGW